MTDLSTESTIAPLALARLSAELLAIREKLKANDVGPLERVRLAARGIKLRELLGASAPAPAPSKAEELAAELAAAKADVARFDKQINAGALNKDALAALDRYSAAYAAVQQHADDQAWEAGKARVVGAANSKPHTISAKDALTPAGAIKADAKNSKADSAIWYYQGDIQALGFTASVTIGGEKSAGADRARHILERLRAAKAQGYRLANYRAGSLGTVWVLTTSDGNSFVSRAGFEEMVNPVFARPDMPEPAPGYESMQAQQKALATAFLGWLDTLSYEQRHNQGVVARKISSTRIGSWLRMESDKLGLYIQYVGPNREFGIRITGADFEGMVTAARKVAVMPEIEAAPAELPEVEDHGQPDGAQPIELTGGEFGDFPDTPEGKKALRAAAKAYLEGMRGQLVDCPALGGKVEIRQRGIKETMAFSGNPKKLKLLHAVPQIIAGAKTAERQENHKKDKKGSTEAYYYLKSAVVLAGESIETRVVIEQDDKGQLYYDLMIEPPKEMALLDATGSSPDHYSGRPAASNTAIDGILEHSAGGVMLDDAGQLVLNLFLEGEEPEQAPAPEPQPQQEPAAPAPEIIEYKTKKGKALRGIIRTDLTLDQAKAIDPYTWKMNGGYFIREKHLGGDTAHVQAAPAPVVMTAEQQAEAQATAERLAEERARAALATQVEKLRQVANKAIGDADDSMGASRKTNTAKRAREAGYAYEKAAANKAAGETLNRLADAIEIGAGGVLSKLSSRAQLEELQRIMRRAMTDADEKLDYRERTSRSGRAFEDNDLKFLAFPRPWTWSNRFKRAAETLATKSPKGNSRLIAALAKLGNGPERVNLDATTIALTRKGYAELKAVKEGWDLADPMETIARADRLARMGVTDTASLVAAVQALIPHQVEKAKEDPVKLAEREIIGQKVGIDFFPTPAHVAQRMARLAHIREGMRVLEPSAGNGNLADAAKAEGGVVEVIEIAERLRNILTAKGYNVVAHDFDGFMPDEKYPAILMNPPFSNRRDAAHIMRAFDMLAGGGTLVAIAGEGVFFGKDKQAEAFRDWLDAHGAEVEQLEGGTFQDNALLAQTSANARLIVLRK